MWKATGPQMISMRRFREAVLRVLREDQQIEERPAFGLLPEQSNRRRSFAFSTVANAIALVLFLVFSLTHLPRVKPEPMQAFISAP
jgi:hypothetical protein